MSDALRAERDEWKASFEEQRDEWEGVVHGAADIAAERDALRAEVERLKASYEKKVEDLSRETLRVSEALSKCAERGIKSPAFVVGEAGLGWDRAMEHVEHAIHSAVADA